MGLDLKDRKILAELEMDARVTHSEIAKRVLVSKQVAKYRIERLEDEGYIEGYNAIVDVSTIGEIIYVVYLKLIRLSNNDESDFMKKMNSHTSVLAVRKNAGHFDLTVVLRTKDRFEFDKTFRELIKNYEHNIKQKLVTSEIESTYFSTNLFFKVKQRSFSTSKLKTNINENDEKIINELSKNCRISLIKLSDITGLSANGVRERIKNLEKNKIILGYKAKLNYEKAGYLHFRVFLHLNDFDLEVYNKIKHYLKNSGNVESVSRYIGHSDIDFRCYAKNLEEFYDFISKLKDKFLNNINEVESIPIFRWKKIKYYSK